MRFPSFSGRACAGALLLLFVSCAALADQPPHAITDEAPEPLQRAIADAWRAQPASRAAESTLAAARARASAAGRPLYNPEFELEAEDEGSEGDRSATIGLRQTIDFSGKRRARSALGRAEFAVAEHEYSLKRAEFALAWLTALSQRETAARRVALGEQRIALSTRFADLALRQFKAGDISGLERDLAMLARDEAVAEHATLLSEMAAAEQALAVAGGGANSVELPPTPPPVDLDAPIDVTSLPAWHVAAAARDRAQQRIEVARTERRADPSIGVRTGRVDFGPVSDNVIGVSLSIPLFVRNRFRDEVVAATADADASSAELDRAALELEARIARSRTSHAAFSAAWTRWRASTGTDVATRADLLERLLRAGELSTADYVVQLKQTLDTALAGAELEGRLWQSWFEFLFAIGELEHWAGLNSPQGSTR